MELGGCLEQGKKHMDSRNAKEVKSFGLSSVDAGSARSLGLLGSVIPAVGKSRRNRLWGEGEGLAPEGHPGGCAW